MPQQSAWALQKGLYEALIADGTVSTLLGGVKIYDVVPQHVAHPFVTFAQTVSRDFGSGTEDGEEHVVTLNIWSRTEGKRQTQEIIGAIRNVLHGQTLTLEDHYLVNLRHEFSDTKRDAENEHFIGIVRFRAVTEPML